MADSRPLIVATIVSSIFASVAALAGTVQAYVSWTGRYDTLKASMTQSAITVCAEFSTATRNYADANKTLFRVWRDRSSTLPSLGQLSTKERSQQNAKDLMDTQERLRKFETEMKELAIELKATGVRFHEKQHQVILTLGMLNPRFRPSTSATAIALNAYNEAAKQNIGPNILEDHRLQDEIVRLLYAYLGELDVSCSESVRSHVFN